MSLCPCSAMGPAGPWGNAPHATPGAREKAFAMRIWGLKETHLQQEGGGSTPGHAAPQ